MSTHYADYASYMATSSSGGIPGLYERSEQLRRHLLEEIIKSVDYSLANAIMDISTHVEHAVARNPNLTGSMLTVQDLKNALVKTAVGIDTLMDNCKMSLHSNGVEGAAKEIDQFKEQLRKLIVKSFDGIGIHVVFESCGVSVTKPSALLGTAVQCRVDPFHDSF